jgi:acetylornithine deacetylase
MHLHLFELTRRLVDIDSTTGDESTAARFVAEYLRAQGAQVSLEDAAPGRPNVFAHWGALGAKPRVVFSTHLDTVPPYFASSEDAESIRGRGSCDAKGIAASMMKAAEGLREGVGLLFLVGEERDSIGAKYANEHPRGCEYLIDGEPTENQLALGSKGALRVVVTGRGRMAHSAYPHLGESAIDKLVEALHRIAQVTWPVDTLLGASTSNVGTITGGRAPNVISDFARAELLIRLVGDSAPIKRAVDEACAGLADVEYVLDLPAVHLGALEGLPTTVVSFTTDIPSLTAWGKPYLLGPGSITVAHTDNEFVSKHDLEQAVELYSQIAKKLLRNGP